MLSRITGQAAMCRERAEVCRKLADDPTFDAVSRNDFADMQERWLKLAHSFETAEEISGYLEWQARRVDYSDA